jgi:hypothetical protein
VSSFIASLPVDFNVVPFEIPYIEKQWTKRDCFKIMKCDVAPITESKQRLGGYSLWQNSVFSIQFVDEWLRYAQDERILTDLENQLSYENYEGFVAHRHDQSIFSILSKKYGIVAYRDPSQSGNNFVHLYPNSTYPQFIVSTRQIDIGIIEKLKKKIRKYLPNKLRIWYRKIKMMFREH